jgi:fumarate hydratase subunit beta
MAETKKITTPLTDETLADLKIGDSVLITGDIFCARDSAHKKLLELIDKGEPLPIELKGAAIYYAGPSPAKPGQPVGSIGPTTSYRMDFAAPKLHELGLKASIGKGNRGQEVRDALVKHKAVYLMAVGGAAALLAKSVKAREVVAYPELGPEAIAKLTVEDFPAIVANDIYGGDIFEEGVKKYRKI